jgi:hypothetical protein
MTSKPAEDRMSKPAQRSFWFRLVQALWFICALVTVGVILAALPVYWFGILEGSSFSQTDISTSFDLIMNLVIGLMSLFAALLSLFLAAVLFWRKADDLMALSLSFFLLIYSFTLTGPLEVLLDFHDLPLEIAMLGQTFLLTVPVMAFTFLFPNGRFVPGWTRWALLIAVIVTPLLLLMPIDQWYSSPSPILYFVFFIHGVIFILGVYSQIFRYRNVSSSGERQQTKWVLYGFLLYLVLLMISSAIFVRTSNLPPGEPQSWWSALGSVLWVLTLSIMPIAIFISIQRYRLWEIDLIIRRTLIYGALTLLLALVYFASVVLLQQGFRALTGQDSPIAIVISTLMIAAIFNPLRRRVQDTIDHRFYRRKYDAQQALAAFAATARDEVELDQLTEQLLSVVQESMQPERASLWLRAGEKK